jgi:tRNA 2-thiocytidine biosynthesis protein TtcA
MVCLSGGKDSQLLDVSRCKNAPVAFNRRRQPRPDAGFPADVLPVTSPSAVAFHIAEQDTYSVVKRLIPEGATMCSLCSRLRRGIISRRPRASATKIALGHHRDDLMAFFLNLFFGGKLKTMPPKLVSDDGRHVVIRPLAYVRERDLTYAARKVSAHSVHAVQVAENLQRKRLR